MNRRKMLLSTLGSTLAVNGVSIAAASTPPLFQRESLPQEFSKVISPGKLRILVLSGSPHKDGTTNLLATNFVKGAKEAGHEVRHVNTSFEDINACRGCFFCLKNSGQCLIRDDVPAILHLIEQADVVIFVTPIYYYAIHSSLKALLERFTSRRTDFMKMPKKMALNFSSQRMTRLHTVTVCQRMFMVSIYQFPPWIKSFISDGRISAELKQGDIRQKLISRKRNIRSWPINLVLI